MTMSELKKDLKEDEEADDEDINLFCDEPYSYGE